MNTGIITAISNHKGGVGKTMTAVNLGASLAIQKKKVLLIDNDPQSDSTRALIDKSSYFNNSIYQILDSKGSITGDAIKDFIYPTIQKNLFILPNITQTSGLDMTLNQDFPDCNYYLNNSIKDYVKENFDYIFIDCPPALSIFVTIAFYCADFVIVPMTAGSGNSLEGVRGALDLLASIKSAGNPDLAFFKILINKLDRRKSAHKANILALYERFGKDRVFKTTIPTDTAFEMSETITKSTVFTYSKASRGAQSFRTLRHEFLTILKN